ncbi:hypothetical protein EON71_00570 [bacterium]|nr:MAG: hypothetical protein EON71_00570 [bacterium]
MDSDDKLLEKNEIATIENGMDIFHDDVTNIYQKTYEEHIKEISSEDDTKLKKFQSILDEGDVNKFINCQPITEDVNKINKKEVINCLAADCQNYTKIKDHIDAEKYTDGKDRLLIYHRETHYQWFEKNNEVIIFGNIESGNSVAISVTGFKPYFYLRKPNVTWTKTQWSYFFMVLENTLIINRSEKNKKYDYGKNNTIKETAIIGWEEIEGISTETFDDEEHSVFLKITVSHPDLVRDCKNLLEYPNGKEDTIDSQKYKKWWPNNLPLPEIYTKFSKQFQGNIEYFQIFEANIKYVNRFNTDLGLKPCDWFEIDITENFEIVSKDKKKTKCDIELKICKENIIKKSDPNKTTTLIPPELIYSYDIETELGTGKKFSNPEDNAIKIIGYAKSFRGNIIQGAHCVGSVFKTPGLDIKCYPTETEMLIGFAIDLNKCDPDTIIGYNSSRFDANFILRRMEILEVPINHQKIGRTNEKTQIVTREFKTAARSLNTYDMSVVGRTVLDICILMMLNYKLESYTLQFVSKKFLKKGKADIDIKKINEMYNTIEGRTDACYYCTVDSILPYEIMEKEKLMLLQTQMAFVTGLSVNTLYNGGQQCKILSLALIESKNDGYRIRTIPSYRELTGGYEGATVIPPKPGLYKIVTTLDFTSLYPSIQIAHNLCTTTYVERHTIEKYGLEEGIHIEQTPKVALVNGKICEIKNPEGPCFLQTQIRAINGFKNKYPNASGLKLDEDGFVELNKDNVMLLDKVGYQLNKQYTIFTTDSGIKKIKFTGCKVGLLVKILQKLLKNRKEVKLEQKKHTFDSLEYKVLEARQLALKVTSNSIYGMTGASVGSVMPCQEVAYSVTTRGREYINYIKEITEKTFNIAAGKDFEIVVVYGDTDSIFAWFKDLSKVMYRSDGTVDMDKIIDASIEISKYITKLIDRYPLNLDYEKTFKILYLFSKKKYAGIKIVPVTNKENKQLTYKGTNISYTPKWYCPEVSQVWGMESVRRDPAPIIKRIVEKCIDLLLNEKIVEAVEFYRDIIYQIRSGRVHLTEFIYSKTLSNDPKDYKNPCAQSLVAKKKGDYRVGDRVFYIIRSGISGEKTSEKGVDPMEAFENGLDLDYDYYIDQLQKPIMKIFHAALSYSENLEKIEMYDTFKDLAHKEWIYINYIKSTAEMDTDFSSNNSQFNSDKSKLTAEFFLNDISYKILDLICKISNRWGLLEQPDYIPAFKFDHDSTPVVNSSHIWDDLLSISLRKKYLNELNNRKNDFHKFLINDMNYIISSSDYGQPFFEISENCRSMSDLKSIKTLENSDIAKTNNKRLFFEIHNNTYHNTQFNKANTKRRKVFNSSAIDVKKDKIKDLKSMRNIMAYMHPKDSYFGNLTPLLPLDLITPSKKPTPQLTEKEKQKKQREEDEKKYMLNCPISKIVLSEGKHASNIHKEKPYIYGFKKANFLQDKCLICKTIVVDSHHATCSACSKLPLHIKNKYIKKLETDTNNAVEKYNKCMDKCVTCRETVKNVVINACTNMNCVNLFDRDRAFKEADKLYKICNNNLDW